MEHTKGPWAIDGGTNKKGDLFIWKAGEYYGGHAIATIHGEIQEDVKANARLIAAAPDLLAACKGILIYAHEIAERADIDDGHAFWAYIADAADAIAAAEGGVK